MKKLPIVAFIGQTNVGKSSLFNAILGERQTIVAKEPGTTRDSIQEKVMLENQAFWLVDTAGAKTPEDDFELTIQEQIDQAIENADLILFVIEADIPITTIDRKLAKKALKSNKPVLLVVNKADKVKKIAKEDYLNLGLKEVVLTSATQKSGVDFLLTQIAKHIPAVVSSPEDDVIRVALVGRPNVGKSYLFNNLVKKQLSIVSDVAGTTRDVNKKIVNYHERPIELMDTAGIRRPGRIERGIEKFSVLRTLSAVENSDICLMVMDANELNSKLDQKIAGMVKDAGKGLILVVSKWDSVEKDAFTHVYLSKTIANNFQHVNWAPLVFTSAKTGQNVTKLFDLILEIDGKRHIKIETSKLNSWLEDCRHNHPPAGLKNSHPKLRYITQTDISPPAFKIFGTQTGLLHWSYKRYLERQLREVYDLDGTPINFYFTNRETEK